MYDRNIARIWDQKAREKDCSIREASATSGIPYATIYRLAHNNAVHKSPNVQ